LTIGGRVINTMIIVSVLWGIFSLICLKQLKNFDSRGNVWSGPRGIKRMRVPEEQKVCAQSFSIYKVTHYWLHWLSPQPYSTG
jgi:hypothetical protein